PVSLSNCVSFYCLFCLRSLVTDYSPGCVNITTFQCELSNFNISCYGTYIAKVRALLGEDASAWVESKYITLDKETLISPPSVSLLPIGQTLEVSIKDPEFKICSLRNVYTRLRYNITYWKEGQEEQERIHNDYQQDRVILDDLDPLTKYCVQVQLITLTNPTESSGVLCERTGDTENSPVVAAVIACAVIAVAVAVTVPAMVKWKSISHFIWPKVSLPRHFEKVPLLSEFLPWI
uniref:Interleukin-10 receptor subunit beta-like n=1 Tax=Poecilia latipinna TaxID=48699 RepID=A0A3B3UQY7_9TELE